VICVLAASYVIRDVIEERRSTRSQIEGKPVEYTLLIMRPGGNDKLRSYKAATPFIATNVGDYIVASSIIEDQQATGIAASDRHIRVARVLHFFIEKEDRISDIVVVFTEEAPR
jgi:hypothetical protein